MIQVNRIYIGDIVKGIFIFNHNFNKIDLLRNGTLIKYVFMHSYFFFLQDKKRRRCKASTRLFNEVEWENSKQKNVILLLNHS